MTEADSNKASGQRLEIKASFRVFGPNLDPETVTTLLGVPPSSMVRRGEPLSRSPRATAKAKGGVWSLDSSASPTAPIEMHLEALLAVLRERSAALAALRSRGHELEIFVGVFDIDSADELLLLANRSMELGMLGIDLRLDLYPADQQ